MRGRRLRPREPDDDVRREVESHLEERVEELTAQGWGPEEARREAVRRFGDPARVREDMLRHVPRSGSSPLSQVGRDLRYAVRTLLRNPGFALVAAATLALGIGANTAIFSVVDAVLLRPLPYPEPDRLAWVAEENVRGRPMRAAWPNVQDWKERSRSVSALSAFWSAPMTVLGAARPLRAQVAAVGEGFWEVFPVRPHMGRLTVPDDHRQGAPPVAVVSHGFWRNHLGSDPDVLERSLEAGGHSLRVVGVLPPGFDFPDAAALWRPVELDPANTSRSSHNFSVVGRLAPGVDAAAAQRELDGITAQVLEGSAEDPDYLAHGTFVTPLIEEVAGEARDPLVVLLGAAALVLLVACTNLASMLLARGSTRVREMAVRSSLGAGRGTLIRQLLTESAVLALVGTAAGLAVSVAVVEGLRVLGPASLPRLDEVGLDPRVLGFTLVLAVAVTLLFGLLPALRLSRSGGQAALRSGSRGNALRGRATLWHVLVGTEVALALVLLVGSGLLIRSFWHVVTRDPGFDPQDVVAAPVSPSQVTYEDAASVVDMLEELLAELEADPAVSAAGLTTALPVAEGVPTGRLELDGDMSRHADGGYVAVSDGYFDAMDVPVLLGRAFTEQDRADSRHVAVVSRSFAERWWPGEDPVGRSVTGGGMDMLYDQGVFSTVVGVVGDVRYRGLTGEPTPVVYFSQRQRPFRTRFGTTAVVEGRPGAGGVAGALRRAMGAVDPDLPVEIRPLPERIRATVADRRFTLVVLGSFAGVALLLALVGIYGVVSYTVARRTREVGIRLALGAAPGEVRRMVLRGVVLSVMVGVTAGAAGALALGGALEGLLVGVGPSDPLTLLLVPLLLGGSAVAAGWISARRSLRIDPMIAMRTE